MNSAFKTTQPRRNINSTYHILALPLFIREITRTRKTRTSEEIRRDRAMLDPRTHHPTNSFQLYDETRHKTWEAATNSDLWPSKPTQLRTEHMDTEMDVDESDMCSPPRWTTSLSPTSRTEAIVRGQRELMEMVQNMPESNYELSLKDLVEHHHRVVPREENTEEQRNSNSSVYGGGRKVDKIARVKSVKRNGKIDRGGFYLNVAFPFSLGSKDKKKKKKNESSGNCNSKVSPKPPASDGSVKEWWKKSPSAFRESDSGESSVNSGSMKSSASRSSNSSSSRRSNSRRENQKGGGRCWPFIRRHKRQTKK